METSAEMIKKVPAVGTESSSAPSLFKRHEKTGKYHGFASFGSGKSVVSVILEVADTPEKREKGLMGRESLPECCGMLFTGLAGGAFWMKNCKIPLDIVFLEDGKVSRMYGMPADNGARLYRYTEEDAIELPYGFCDRHGIGIGTKCSWRTW